MWRHLLKGDTGLTSAMRAVLLLLFATIQTLRAQRAKTSDQDLTCGFRNLYEVTVEGENGIYCLITEPCSGTVFSNRYACPTLGQKDVTGMYTLSQESCCAELYPSQIIACVVPNTSTQCILSAPLSNSTEAFVQSESEEPLAIPKSTEVHSNQNHVVHSNGPQVITPIEDDNKPTVTIEGLKTEGNAFDVDIIVYMCIGTGVLLAIFLGVYFLRKDYSTDTGNSPSPPTWDESTSYSSVPITPKDKIELTS